jgi:hypothetical protein
VQGRRGTSPQEHLEGREWGRALLSVFIAITVATVLVMQLPNSYLRTKLDRLAQPYANATGLDQNWQVFAPDPRRRSIDLEGRVKYADGSQATWHIPRSNNFVGAWWDYRWRKVMEHAVPDAGAEIWLPLALFVARQEKRASPIVSLDLVRHWSDLRPPGGHGPLQTPWQQYKFFSLPKPLLRYVNGEVSS